MILDPNDIVDPEFDGVYEFSNVPEGTHTVTGYLAGSDDTEIGGTRIFVTFTTRVATDTMPPSVSISAPQNGATVSGPITISAVASDDVRVEGVQFTLEGGKLGSEVITLPYLVTWDTTTVADGIYTLAAVARDSSGNRSSPIQYR